MQLSTVAAASGYLGSALGVAMVVPQILRTIGNRRLPGVSALSWALTALACTSWLLYGIRTGEIPQIPGNVLLVSGAVAVVLVSGGGALVPLVPSRTSPLVRALGLAWCAALAGVLALVAPPAVLGAVGVLLGLVSGLPQLARSMRRRAGVSAVSPLTWALRVASQASWLSYGLMLRDLTVALSATFLLTNALLVLLIETVRRPVATPVPARVAG